VETATTLQDKKTAILSSDKHAKNEEEKNTTPNKDFVVVIDSGVY
jgi:hypothetical protein